jgi:hypothetical protein
MIMPEVGQSFGAKSFEEAKQFRRRDFVSLGARPCVRRRKNMRDHAVAPGEQPAAFDPRLAARTFEHFVQDFRANADGLAAGHAFECTPDRTAGDAGARARAVDRKTPLRALARGQAETLKLPELDGAGALLDAPPAPAANGGRNPPIC